VNKLYEFIFVELIYLLCHPGDLYFGFNRDENKFGHNGLWHVSRWISDISTNLHVPVYNTFSSALNGDYSLRKKIETEIT